MAEPYFSAYFPPVNMTPATSLPVATPADEPSTSEPTRESRSKAAQTGDVAIAAAPGVLATHYVKTRAITDVSKFLGNATAALGVGVVVGAGCGYLEGKEVADEAVANGTMTRTQADSYVVQNTHRGGMRGVAATAGAIAGGAACIGFTPPVTYGCALAGAFLFEALVDHFVVPPITLPPR